MVFTCTVINSSIDIIKWNLRDRDNNSFHCPTLGMQSSSILSFDYQGHAFNATLNLTDTNNCSTISSTLSTVADEDLDGIRIDCVDVITKTETLRVGSMST